MTRGEASKALIAIAAWVMGALMGSQMHRPIYRGDGPVRFAPGVYQIERVDGSQAYWVDYATDWQVRFLAPPASE
jgi:hypothetical protein